MQSICPGDTRAALEVFCLYEAEGEYFDISDPSHVTRYSIVIGQAAALQPGYFAGSGLHRLQAVLRRLPPEVH